MSADPPRRIRAASIAAPLLLALIVVGFYWKLVLTDQYTWLENPDAAHQIVPWVQEQAREWHQGRFPLWDPYQRGGQSLIGQVITGSAYPPNWLLFLLPLRDGYVRFRYLHWYWVLIHVQAALFCYLLCRDLGRSRGASLLAGLVFSLAGYVGTTGWPQMLNGIAWAPLVFLFELRALRWERPLANFAVAGMFLGISWLSGHHQAPIFVTLGAAVLWLDALVREPRGRRPLAVGGAIFAAVFVLSAGLQLLPAYEYGRLAVRWVNADHPVRWDEPVPYTVHREFSMSPDSVLGIVLPGVHRLNDPYLGIVAVSLTLLGVAAAAKQPAVRRMLLLSFVGLALALGGSSVFHGIAYALVPLVEKARTPLAAACLFSLGMAVVVAFGVDGFDDLRATAWPRRAARVLGGFAAALFLLETARLVLATPPPKPEGSLALSALVAALLALLLAAWYSNYLARNTAAALLVLLTVFELGNFIAIYLPNKNQKELNPYLSRLAENADIAGFLRQAPGPFRVEVDPKEIPYNFGDWHGIEVYGGYVASLPENVYRQDWTSPRVRNLYNVRYTLAREPRSPEQKEEFRGASGLKVFSNPDAFPRAWTVHQAAQAPGLPPDPRQVAFLDAPVPHLEPCGTTDRVEWLVRQPGQLSLNVRMGCRGLLVVADNFFPGWKAAIDGAGAAILETDGSLRGIVVPAGAHRVEMHYRPRSVYLGAAMTLFGLITGIGAWTVAGRGNRASPTSCQ